MHVGATFVPNAEPAKAIEPRAGALDDPTMAPQARLRVDADARNAAANAVRMQKAAAVGFVIPFVGVHLVRAPAWVPALTERAMESRNRIEHVLEHHRVIHVRGREERGERNAVGVDHHMALRARFRAIRWIRPGRFAPLFAETLMESTAARLQSI